MKLSKFIPFLLVSVLLLTSCTTGKSNETTAIVTSVSATDEVITSSQPEMIHLPQIEDDRSRQLLNFPGVEWGMSAEDIIQALALNETDYELISDRWQKLCVYNVNCFDTPATKVEFYLDLDSGFDITGLQSILVYYPSGTDMDSVKTVLEKNYGPAQSSYKYYFPEDYAGNTIGKEKENGVPFEMKFLDENECCWMSHANIDDYLAGDVLDEFLAHWLADSSNAKMPVISEYVKIEPISRIFWQVNYKSNMTEGAQNVLQFGSHCAALQTYVEHWE